MSDNDNNIRHKLEPLSHVVSDLKKQGYTEDFRLDKGKLKTYSGQKQYDPDQISVLRTFRFEGPSNPADMSILYVLETSDGQKGTLTDAYGADASPELQAFMEKANYIG